MNPKLRDNIVYLSVGAFLFAALATFVFYSAETKGKIPDIPGVILWAAISTPVLLALIFERFWEFRKRWSFWILATVTLCGNFGLILIGEKSPLQPPLLVWTLLSMIWIFIIFRVGQGLFTSRS